MKELTHTSQENGLLNLYVLLNKCTIKQGLPHTSQENTHIINYC